MAKAKQWTVTHLSGTDALVLVIEDTAYRLASFTMTYALNRVPTAVGVLAIGRDVFTGEQARIHDTAKDLRTMLPVKVFFEASGEFDADGRTWPKGPHLIFEGFFQGFSHRKYLGKVQVVANAIHWLVDLGFSSTLSSLHHPSNPASLVSPAVFAMVAGSGGPPVFIPHHIGHEEIVTDVPTDLWGGMHNYLTKLAEWKGLEVNADLGCLGVGNPKKNDRAIRALKKFEGPAGRERKYSKPLALKTAGLDLVAEAVSDAVQGATLESFFNQTFWNVMVAGHFPQFAMALVPMADRALVIADTPGYSGGVWRRLKPDEYVFTEQNASIPMPLRGIAIYAGIESATGGTPGRGTGRTDIGGCFVSDAEEDADGVIRFLGPPAWLKNVPSTGEYAGTTTGQKGGDAAKSGSTPKAGDRLPVRPLPHETFRTVSQLMRDFAHAQFIQNNLRGRSAEIVGKLRFDIAPGSHLRIDGSPEQFMAGVDGLAADTFGTVWRTTISISAEERQAITALSLSHLRNEAENQQLRTSTPDHPLFAGAVIDGAPILEALEFDE
jgi:hypothetical protein